MAEVVQIIGNLALLALHVVDAYQRSRTEPTGRHPNRRSLTALSNDKYPRAVLLASSTITFGNDCERLVNIAFQTSQTFPTMMGSCADIIQYLRQELGKQYPDEYFYIILSENDHFGFSVDDHQYYAEIAQDRYRVLIFTTKRNLQIKSDTHDVNSQMILKWK